MLTQNTLTDPKQIEKERRLEEIGRVIRLPFGVEKVQAIAVLWMSDPDKGAENRRQMAGCALMCKEIRETRANKFGSSTDANSGLRSASSPPAGLMVAVDSFCYDGAFIGAEGRKNWKIFRQALPQFNTSEVW